MIKSEFPYVWGLAASILPSCLSGAPRPADSKMARASYTHHLVRSHRLAGKVRQPTLLNLGRHFQIPQTDWSLLCRRIDQLLRGPLSLLKDCPAGVEEEAQRIAAS